MAVVDALVRLKADTAQFSKAMSDASKATDNVAKSADNTAGILSKKLKVGFGVAAAAAGAFVIKLGRDSVQAAQTAGAAQNRLRKLLLNTNGATEAQIQVLLAQGKALEDLTGISKENVTVVQSQLATFDLHGSTIAKLTPTILDYVVAEKGASAGADEFRMMTTGLAQAINGNFGALTKQGFVLDANTKKMIASGTESERAAAIVDVLNFTYRDFASTAGGPAAIAQRKFQNSINDTKEALGNALLPVIGSVTGGLSTVLQPALTALQEKFADGTSVQNFVGFIGGLLKNLFDFAKAIVTVFEPVFTGLIVPAIKLAIGAVIGLIKVLGAIGRFITKNATAFQVLVGAVVAVAAAMAAYLIQIKVVTAAHKAFIFMAALKGKSIKMLTKYFRTLNFVMKLNPMGIIIAAAALLAVGFMMLWKKSETFRKIIITIGKAGLTAFGFLIRVVGVVAEALINIAVGPLKLFLKALSYISPDAKDAYNGLKGMTDGVGKFFDGAAEKVEGFKKNLDGLNKKEVEGPKVKKAADTPLDLASLGRSDKVTLSDKQVKALAAAAKKAEAAAKKLAEMQRNLEEAVSKYNEYLSSDFAKSFEKGADAARDGVAKALDNLNAVFEAKGKMLSGSALANLRGAFDKIKKDVQAMTEDLAAVADLIKAKSDELDEATKDLEKALEERASAMKKIGELLATPFGQASEVQKALSGAEATVDSIIGMYDKLVEIVNQRFTELAPGARDAVKDYLYAQTNGLLDAARARVKAIKVLEAAQDRLDNLIGDQKQFSASLTSSLKSFATAIADLAKTDAKATYTVIKTATGLVITQLKKSTSGVDTITEQLKQRLKTIADFASNANKLLASGLNRDYVRQLLEAGPEAAGQAVTALATANEGQIAEINSLYSQIGVVSDQFGIAASDKMYAQAIAMTTAFRDGAELGVELIDATMKDIVSNISAIMGVLGNTGLTNANDLINALVGEFDRQSKETVGPATQLVVDKIKSTISVLSAVGLENAQGFINGLIGALSGKDNLNNVNLSATTIKTNIDTIMKLLAPEALTSGLGLINSLTTAFGGENLTLVTNSATAVKESIVTALASLKTLGGELAADIVQGIVDKLAKEKADLVAIATSIAAAITAAMAGAAAGIGVIVDGASGDLAVLNKQIADTANAAAALAGAGDKKDTGGGGGGGGGGGLTAAQKLAKAKADALKYDLAHNVPRYGKMGESLVPNTSAYAAGYSLKEMPANYMNPDVYKKLFGPKTDPLKPLGTYFNTGATSTATTLMPNITLKQPTPVPTPTAPAKPTLLPMPNYSASGAGSQGGGTTANVTINTLKYFPTITPTTVASAVSKSVNTKKR